STNFSAAMFVGQSRPPPSLRSSFAPFANEPFLGHRRDQSTVALEDKSARKSARPGSTRTVLRVEQPFVGPERPMKPKRMIEARSHDAPVENGAAVRDQRRVEQHHVGRIGQHTLVDCRIVRQRTGGPDPDMKARIFGWLAEITFKLDRTQFDRSFL